MCVCCSIVEGDDGQTAGHGLGDDITKGLSEAWKEEKIARGIVSGEIVADARTSEDQVRVFLLQMWALGTVANQHKARARTLPLDGVETGECQGQILLRRDPTHIEDDQIVFGAAPGSAQFSRAPLRCELIDVDSAPEDMQILEALGSQAITQLDGWNQRGIGAVVEMSQCFGDLTGQGT
jgi:hypothetical protein